MNIATPDRKDAKIKLLDAALAVIRGQGYAATSVDALCRVAGVTKGAFVAPEGLAQAVIQGGYVLAKATGDPDAARDALDRNLAFLFQTREILQ